MSKRNVLLITADQLRGDALHCTGADFLHTPNLDRLAADGVNFIRGMTPNPICVPARACITTGNYPHRCTGNKNNSGCIRDDQIKIADHFNQHGYRSYALGKLHYVPYQKPRLLHGFQTAEITESGRILKQEQAAGHDLGGEDYHDYLKSVGYGGMQRAHGCGNNDVHPNVSPIPSEHYVDAWITTRSIHHISRHRREHPDQPFFMWTSYPKPHSPYDPPEPYHNHYDPRYIPPPVGSPDLLEGRSRFLTQLRDDFDWQHLSPQAIQLCRARYFGLISFQDVQIGRLLRFLDEQGLADDTIILYTADHGDLMGDFGCFFKANFLNGSVRVPFILRSPGQVPGGQVSRQLVGLQDVLPTLTSLAGAPLTESVDGVDLTPSVNDPSREVRPCYVAQCFGDPQQSYMVFDGRYKYIYSQWDGIEELYDQQEDPAELRNLAGQAKNRSRTSNLRGVLIDWCRDNGDEAALENGDLKKSIIEPPEHPRPIQGRMGWRYF